jgi:hypothetical protein
MKHGTLFFSPCVLGMICLMVVISAGYSCAEEEPSDTLEKNVPSSSISEKDNAVRETTSDDVDIVGNEENLLFREFDKIMEEDMNVLFGDTFAEEVIERKEQTPAVLPDENANETVQKEESLVSDNEEKMMKDEQLTEKH